MTLSRSHSRLSLLHDDSFKIMNQMLVVVVRRRHAVVGSYMIKSETSWSVLAELGRVSEFDSIS